MLHKLHFADFTLDQFGTDKLENRDKIEYEKNII